MIIKPYLLVPRLIPQPTWGGTFVAAFKGLDETGVGTLPIGQSYELATEASLSTVSRSNLLPIEIASADDGKVSEVIGDHVSLFSLQSLIDQDPAAVLGKKVADKHKSSMPLLIKFTQAKGNSFQVHVRPEFHVNSWKPKPESWYFFEKGKITLGLKVPIQVDAYKQVCTEIESKTKELGEKLSTKELTVEEARKQLTEFIVQHSPYQFVNELMVEPGTVIDLSAGGLHHSWEEGDEAPNGNIVYEVQLNVMDKEATLRSFDKGKVSDDGSFRPVHVDDYFAALDTAAEHNDPKLIVRTATSHSDQGVNMAKLFDTLHYHSSLISFSRQYKGQLTLTSPEESFHHLFVKSGDIELQTANANLHIKKGSSVFIPSSTGQYILNAESTASFIKTWI